MKLGMIITQTEPETVFNALRLALYSLRQGDQVRIPSDADQRSELMPIAIPISCRSPFQSDGDHRSNPRPISSGRV